MASGKPNLRGVRFRVVTALQRHVVNPITTRSRAQTLLETTGRRSGLPRLTPVGGRQVGREFWLVSEHGRRSQYIRNIMANPEVRVRIKGRWHRGVAYPLSDDDPHARLRRLPRLNSATVKAVGTDLLTVRVDLLD